MNFKAQSSTTVAPLTIEVEVSSKTRTFNFTKSSLFDVPNPPDRKRYYYYDTKVKGLILDVRSKGSKTFYLYKKIDRKPERICIGSFPDLSVENARKEAMVLLGQIANGRNPQADKRKVRDEMTFEELYLQYMERYSKLHKKSWKYDEREIPKFLSGWFKLRLSDIKKAEVQLLHERIFKNNGLYQANRILERVRAMFNKAIEWNWEGINPTTGIKKYKEKSRDRFVQPFEMNCLVESLNIESNRTAHDYFWILLFTGARKTNTLMMRWVEIDWDHKMWRIPDSKNGDPILIPLIDRAIDLLSVRKQNAINEWVFPGDGGSSHYADPKRAWNRIRQRATIMIWQQDNTVPDELLNDVNIYQHDEKLLNSAFKAVEQKAKKANVNLPVSLMDIRIHDLRRTLGSYQAITGSSMQIIGKSLGHKSLQSTQVYARLTLDPVRESVERAAKAMFD